MAKRSLAWILTLAMLLGAMPVISLVAFANETPYALLDFTGDTVVTQNIADYNADDNVAYTPVDVTDVDSVTKKAVQGGGNLHIKLAEAVAGNATDGYNTRFKITVTYVDTTDYIYQIRMGYMDSATETQKVGDDAKRLFTIQKTGKWVTDTATVDGILPNGQVSGDCDFLFQMWGMGANFAIATVKIEPILPSVDGLAALVAKNVLIDHLPTDHAAVTAYNAAVAAANSVINDTDPTFDEIESAQKALEEAIAGVEAALAALPYAQLDLTSGLSLNITHASESTPTLGDVTDVNSVTKTAIKGGGQLRLSLPDTIAKKGDAYKRHFDVQVTYLDAPSTGGMPAVIFTYRTAGGQQKGHQALPLTGSGEWKTASFTLDDVQFDDTVNSACDAMIQMWGNDGFAVAGVKIQESAPNTTALTALVNKKVMLALVETDNVRTQYETALAAANTVIADTDPTWDEIDQAYVDLEAAIAAVQAEVNKLDYALVDFHNDVTVNMTYEAENTTTATVGDVTDAKGITKKVFKGGTNLRLDVADKIAGTEEDGYNRHITLTITYLDTTDYVSNLAISYWPLGATEQKNEVAVAAIGNTGEWKSATIMLDDAQLNNQVAGSHDLLVQMWGMGDMAIADVKVSVTAPNTTALAALVNQKLAISLVADDTVKTAYNTAKAAAEQVIAKEAAEFTWDAIDQAYDDLAAAIAAVQVELDKLAYAQVDFDAGATINLTHSTENALSAVVGDVQDADGTVKTALKGGTNLRLDVADKIAKDGEKYNRHVKITVTYLDTTDYMPNLALSYVNTAGVQKDAVPVAAIGNTGLWQEASITLDDVRFDGTVNGAYDLMIQMWGMGDLAIAAVKIEVCAPNTTALSALVNTALPVSLVTDTALVTNYDTAKAAAEQLIGSTAPLTWAAIDKAYDDLAAAIAAIRENLDALDYALIDLDTGASINLTYDADNALTGAVSVINGKTAFTGGAQMRLYVADKIAGTEGKGYNKHFTLTVTYLDAAPTDGMPGVIFAHRNTSGQQNNTYMLTPLTGSGEWKTETFTVDNVVLDGQVNSTCDAMIQMWGNDAFAVSSVKIEVTAPNTTALTALVNTPVNLTAVTDTAVKEAYTTALAAANTVIADTDATWDEIDKAYADLQNALAAVQEELNKLDYGEVNFDTGISVNMSYAAENTTTGGVISTNGKNAFNRGTQLYLAVTDKIAGTAESGYNNHFDVTITYLDADPTGGYEKTVYFRYKSAADNTVKAYPVAQLGGTGEWKSVTFSLNDVAFNNGFGDDGGYDCTVQTWTLSAAFAVAAVKVQISAVNAEELKTWLAYGNAAFDLNDVTDATLKSAYTTAVAEANAMIQNIQTADWAAVDAKRDALIAAIRAIEDAMALETFAFVDFAGYSSGLEYAFLPRAEGVQSNTAFKAIDGKRAAVLADTTQDYLWINVDEAIVDWDDHAVRIDITHRGDRVIYVEYNAVLPKDTPTAAQAAYRTFPSMGSDGKNMLGLIKPTGEAAGWVTTSIYLTDAEFDELANGYDFRVCAAGGAAISMVSVRAIDAADVPQLGDMVALDALCDEIKAYYADKAMSEALATLLASVPAFKESHYRATVDEVNALMAQLRAAADMEEEPAGLLGDVNGDGEVTSTDARMVLQYAVKKISADALDLTVADVDGNGEYTSTDARLILQYAVKKIKEFPVNTKA